MPSVGNAANAWNRGRNDPTHPCPRKRTLPVKETSCGFRNSLRCLLVSRRALAGMGGALRAGDSNRSGDSMTRLVASRTIAALACAVVPLFVGGAQQPSTRDTVLDTRLLPPEVEREVTDAFNGSNTVRASGAYEVESGRVVPGDIAVLNGPLTIAGRVNGRVIAINSDVILKPGARVEGQILVVGGNVDGKDDAFIGGDVRTYRQRLTYRREGERLIGSGSSEEDARWWRRRQKWRSHSYSDLRLVSAKTYNRVEGLPILIGPSFGHRSGETRFEIDALGIFRTGDNFEWNSRTIGHSVKSEVSFGRETGLAIGGRLFDVVDPTENWQ